MDIFEQVAEIRWQEGVEEGLKKGIKEGVEQSVRALLANTGLSVAKIALALKIPVSTVKKIQKELQAK